jgi:hypothetical protein
MAIKRAVLLWKIHVNLNMMNSAIKRMKTDVLEIGWARDNVHFPILIQMVKINKLIIKLLFSLFVIFKIVE